MITKRIYLIGLSTELANMLEYDDEVMKSSYFKKILVWHKVNTIKL